MKHITYLLLLCSLSAFGQTKSSQVREYLGDRYETGKPTGTVAFRFEKGVLKRTGDGQKTYSDLLTHVTAYSDAANAGALLGIQVDGKNVSPVMKTSMEATGEVQAIPEKYGGDPKPGFWASVPDSLKLESYKAEMIAAKKEVGRELAPRQGFLMWVFRNFILPFLFVVGLIARFVAKSAFAESTHDINGGVLFGRGIAEYGHAARYVLFGIGIVVCVVELVNMAVSDYFIYESLWWWAVKSFIISAATYFVLTRWIVPNPRKETRGIVQSGNGNFQRLNHG